MLGLKFYLIIKIEKNILPFNHNYEILFLQSNRDLSFIESTLIFPNSFGDSILFLSIFIGLIRADLLKYENLFRPISNFTLFSIFDLLIIALITTNNLSIIFLICEIIYILIIIYTSTAGLIYKIQTIRGFDETAESLLNKALFGSIWMLIALLYIYNKYGTLNYFFLSKTVFTKYEMVFLFVVLSY